MSTLPRNLWSLVGSLLLLELAACSPQPTQDPQLLISVRPTTATDDGADVDVEASATDGFAKPGKGEVTLTTPHGVFGNGLATITMPFDSAGNAWTTFSCDARKDRDCFTAVTIDAVWAGVATGKGTATIDVTGTRRIGIEGCGYPEDAGAPPVVRRCAPPTDNECDGPTDAFLSSLGVSLPNSTGGNGYDDDCDGLVDEGCACPDKGVTKDCWLIPPTQIDPKTGVAAGWCADHSRGSLDCSGQGSPEWSGICRGAQPPADHDSCSAGDFNCDGLQRNSDLLGCRCAIDLNCPTTALRLAPYPDPKLLTGINGAKWLPDAGLASQARNWRWTVIGGDCDNVLPNPTFSLYRSPDSTVASGRVGLKTTVVYDPSFDPPRYLVDPKSAIRAVRASGTNVASIIYPAFSLSGDYVVQGEFDLNSGHYACTQKVEVRAPGVRAELCWDTVGNNDVDLHFARLQGATCATQGWDGICSADGGSDCSWHETHPDWGYPDSADSACKGWGSKQSGVCSNPRLDVDNISCNRAMDDPVGAGFCSPENINIDKPRDGDRFVVGATYYGSSAAVPGAHPHLNIYCNGERVLTTGANPQGGQLLYPLLRTTGGGLGDTWVVATVAAHVDGGNLVACDVETIPARFADQTRDGLVSKDGGADFCVDSKDNQTLPPDHYDLTGTEWVQNKNDGGQRADAGAIPLDRYDWCRH